MTATVSKSSTAPRAMIELVPIPGEASANWLTMAEPRVAPGVVSDSGMAGRLPITMATAMLSPRARPTDRVTAALTPARAAGKTARRTTCHLVAPSAMAASRSATGTAAKAVRLRATMVGRVITARTAEARRMLGPYASPRKSHPKKGTEARKGSTWLAKMGVRTRRPHSPTTMLGTAASSPIRVASGPAIQRGASSDRKIAVPSPIGTISTMATPVVMSVPTTRIPAPYWSAAGFHVPDQTNPRPPC